MGVEGPPGCAEQRSLGEEINAATRQSHTQLNRLILSRLSLGLPPATSSPDAYAFGLSQFAHIFFNIERYAHSLRLRKDLNDEGGCEILDQLDMSALRRSARLRADLDHLLPLMNGHEPLLPATKRFSDRMHIMWSQKPHLVMAYYWVFYMALFSGGRYIRGRLRSAGSAFWGDASCSGGLIDPGFSFLYFDSDLGGDDEIKHEFKRRFHDVDVLLDAQRRQEVVAEAQFVFKNCIALVKDLDTHLSEA